MRVTDIAEDQRVLVVLPWWAGQPKIVLEPEEWSATEHEAVSAGRQLRTLRDLIGCDYIEGTYPFGFTFDGSDTPAATMDEEGRLNGSPVNAMATRLHQDRYGYAMVGDCVVHMIDQGGDTRGLTMNQVYRLFTSFPYIIDDMVYTSERVRKEREEAYDRAS